MIDDELYLSIRVRVPQAMDVEQQGDLVAKAIHGAMQAVREDWPAVHIAGVEATYATFRPLPDTEGQVMQSTRHKGNGEQ